MKRVLMAGIIVLIAASAAHAQAEFKKERHHWAKYKIGTSVTFKMTVKAGGQDMEGKLKQSLSELSEKSYTLKSSADIAGQNKESEEVEEIPKYVGDETLKVGDKEYKCTVWTAKSKEGEKESVSKIWLAEDVKPPLKLEIKDASGTHAITAVAVSEKIKAGEKEYDCVRLEGEMPTEMGAAKAKFWMCADVPGMAVKIELNVQGDQGEAKVFMELSEVDIK